MAYLYLVLVWDRSGFTNAGCPQSEEEQVVGYSSTSDWDSLLLLIMLCFLEVWVLLGVCGECMKSMDTSKTSGLRCRRREGKDKKVEESVSCSVQGGECMLTVHGPFISIFKK